MEKTPKLEIIVISAEQLKCNTSKFFKHNTFVIVRMDSLCSTRTGLDNLGGSFPKWNEKLKLPLAPSAHLLQVEVHCQTPFVDKMLGKAEIPVTDFTRDLAPQSYLRFLSYRLRDKEGEKNGIVNIAVRMDGRVCQIPAARMGRAGFAEVPGFFCRPSLDQIPTGKVGGSSLLVRERRMDHKIAVGIPVSYGYPV